MLGPWRYIVMHRKATFVVIALFALTGLTITQSAPNSSSSQRKVTFRVAPIRPELAERLQIHGIVKLTAVVRPNGSVKSTRVLGGNPVLVDAAVAAVSNWKFEPAQTESTELIQVSFASQ